MSSVFPDRIRQKAQPIFHIRTDNIHNTYIQQAGRGIVAYKTLKSCKYEPPILNRFPLFLSSIPIFKSSHAYWSFTLQKNDKHPETL